MTSRLTVEGELEEMSWRHGYKTKVEYSLITLFPKIMRRDVYIYCNDSSSN